MSHHAYTTINVLHNLYGLPWNEITQAYVSGLRPSSVRASHGEITTDARPWRVTVMLDKDDRIKSIWQEVEVEVPDHVKHGHDLDCKLRALA